MNECAQSVVSDALDPVTQPVGPLYPWDFPGQEYWYRLLLFLQGSL